jgi:hypothetical protein
MGEVQGLMSLKHADVAVGQTIHWPIYNQAGQILFKSGVHIADQQQLNHLLEVGYCDANNLWDSIPSKLPSLEQLGAKTVPDTTSKPAEELNKETIVELDSVRWTVGEVFHLQTHDQAATRYTVRLIGYVKNKSLLVTAPTIDGRSASIREGQAFIIRAFPVKSLRIYRESAQIRVHALFLSASQLSETGALDHHPPGCACNRQNHRICHDR